MASSLTGGTIKSTDMLMRSLANGIAVLDASSFQKFRISMKSETPCKVAAVIYCNSMLRSCHRAPMMKILLYHGEQVDGLLRCICQVKMDAILSYKSPRGDLMAFKCLEFNVISIYLMPFDRS